MSRRLLQLIKLQQLERTLHHLVRMVVMSIQPETRYVTRSMHLVHRQVLVPSVRMEPIVIANHEVVLVRIMVGWRRGCNGPIISVVPTLNRNHRVGFGRILTL